MLRAAGIEAVIKLPGKTLHLLAGLNADQHAAEMRGQLAMPLTAPTNRWLRHGFKQTNRPTRRCDRNPGTLRRQGSPRPPALLHP